VLDFLNELKQKDIRIGLGSSSKNAVLILEKLGILEMFDTIIDGNKIHMSKPHPEVFQRGAAELKLTPTEIVVFEDAQSGVEAAKTGGFYCIGIGDANVLASADAVVTSMAGMTVERMERLVTSD
jgi:beta-phosphoglucomutase